MLPEKFEIKTSTTAITWFLRVAFMQEATENCTIEGK
jgi:hypothetical protein